MSASGARSWIDGTMEVISGLAPRPSTPQRGQHPHPRSAPNSPAGSRASYPGIQRVPSHDYPGLTRAPSYDYPGISRVPSADAMERSLHNDSGHGKSTAQIIRDLKASNAHFSAKTAEMEAEFMNEINRVTREFKEKNGALNDALKEKTQQVASMESRCSSTEARIREQNAQVVKLKDENAFQRMTISDLKNQLRELQDAEYDKRDEVDKWGMEKEEMGREIENLRGQVEMLRKGVESEEGTDSQQILQSWKRLEESQQALTLSTKRLHETQSALANIENTNKRTAKEHARAVQEHSQEISRWKKKHADTQAEWSQREMEMQAKIERLESDENPVIKELNAQLQECDATIASLRDEIERDNTKVTELNVEVAKVKSEAKSREAYRREEAEDLRVMLDAQADEIDHLKEELDECQREMFTKEDDLVAAEKELEEQMDQCNELKKELETLKAIGGSGGSAGLEGNDFVSELKGQLADSQKSLQNLEKELEEIKLQHEGTVANLRQEIDELVADRDGMENRLVTVERERDQAREALEGSNGDSQLDSGGQSTDQLEDMRADAERKNSKIAELERQAKEMAVKMSEADSNNQEIEEQRAKLQAVNQSLEEKTNEITLLNTRVVEAEAAVEEIGELRRSVQVLKEQNEETEKTKKQLLDAQIALVALDNERKKLSTAYREKTEELDRQAREADSKTVESEEFACRIADLVEEVSSLRAALDEKEHQEGLTSRSSAMIDETGVPGDEALHDEIATLKETKSKLETTIEKIRQGKDEQEALMKEKLVDRDTTISALVKSSVTQDQKLRSLRAEIESLKSTDGGDEAVLATRTSRDISDGEDVESLRTSLNDYRELEKKLSSELSSYKKNLFAAELEVQRLRDEMEEAESVTGSGRSELATLKEEIDVMTADHQEKIQERDAAIATLVKQSISQESHISSLDATIASLKTEIESLGSVSKPAGPSWEEVRRLRKESEIFAGQIIEQDEEMEALKGELDGRQSEILSLTNELNALKSKQNSQQIDSREVVRLRAELDELQEANQTQLTELRDLRRKLREAKVDAGQLADLKIELGQVKDALEASKERELIAEQGDPATKSELADALEAKESLEKALSERMESIARSNAATLSLETKLKERDDIITDLKDDLSRSRSSQGEQLATLQSKMDEMKEELLAKSELTDKAQSSLNELRQSLDDSEASKEAEIEELSREVSELKSQLKTLDDDREHIEELKDRLARAEEDRESVEKSIVDSYERKMSLLKLNKDVTIDGLRKELADSKGRNVGDLDDLMRRIHQLEMEKKDISDELDAKLDEKNTKIYALEQHCEAQEQIVENMRAEMDQLQSSMERTTLNRRAEIDEMQQEMLDSSAKTTRQEREITALKIELEESKVQQEAKVAKLLEKIASMEASPLARAVAEQHVDHNLDEVKGRLEQVKWRNTSLEQENSKLRSRLERAESASKAVEDEVDRIEAMEEEIAFLRNRVKELETEKEQSVPASVSRIAKPASESRGRTVQSASPARRTTSSSRRLPFLKIRTRGSSKDFSSDEIPPLPGD